MSSDSDKTLEFTAPARVLVIVAHSDDIEFGIAGTVARWTKEGTTVTYCIVTDSSSGSNEPGADLAALVETRKREQINAARAVGVRDVRFLGYKDGTLTPSLELRRDLARVVRDVRPQIVVTMDPTTVFWRENGYINHPDHRATGEAAVYAVFPSAETRPIFPELLDEGLEPCKVEQLWMVLSPQTDILVDISDVHAQKMNALRAHPSQLDEDVVQMVAQWDAERGKEHGYTFAEGFSVMVMNDPGTTDAGQDE